MSCFMEESFLLTMKDISESCKICNAVWERDMVSEGE